MILILLVGVLGMSGPQEEHADFAESLAIALVPIEPGEFWMGSRDHDPLGSDSERPRRRVRITRPFLMAAHEVTVGQFRRFVEATGYRTEAERDGRGGCGWEDADRGIPVPGYDPRYGWRHTGFPQGDDHPVVNVSWNDAVAFCEWLSREDGRAFRLPTDAEWEYSCRAGSGTAYSFGDDPEGLARHGNVADRSLRAIGLGVPAIDADDGFAFTAPVGHFLPNAWGLYDMHGNVAEWCRDRTARVSAAEPPQDDPVGPVEGEDRVVRNGGWFNGPRLCHSASRSRNPPSSRSDDVGFRVVAVPATDSPSP